MDKNLMSYKEKLMSQIRDAHGKISYSERVHIEQYLHLEKVNKIMKYVKIALMAFSTSGFIGAIATNEIVAVWIGGIFAILLSTANLYYKDFDIARDMGLHRKASDDLWAIREKYVSLLTDFDELSEDNARKRRDELQNEADSVYKEAPKTGSVAFKKAKIALKVNNEQHFTDEELNNLAPKHLRFLTENDNNEGSL